MIAEALSEGGPASTTSAGSAAQKRPRGELQGLRERPARRASARRAASVSVNGSQKPARRAQPRGGCVG
jgi:hypothetical protein